MSDAISAGPAESTRPKMPIISLIKGPLIVGFLIILAFFGLFGGWAATAPLSSGAIASGVVSPVSNRHVIQHLEGGIVRIIHVRNGQQVKAGDPLITLESTRQAADVSSGREQWLRFLVVRARLEAIASGAPAMVIPNEAASTTQPELQAFIANQQSQFSTQRRTQQQMIDISSRQIEQLESEIASIRAESEGLQLQKELVDSQLVDASKLLEEQLISRNQVAALQRDQAQLQGAIASNSALLARAAQSIEQSKLELLQNQESVRISTMEESTQVNNQIALLTSDLESSTDVLRRTEIVSPVDGVVLNLRSQTIGGIVGPGEAILDVVPLGDDMIVLAKLMPRDIDLVNVGLEAHVLLLPFASRNLLPLNGEVTQIAADSTLDELTRQYYYEVTVRVPASELAKHDGLYMSPGMPADVTVVTGARTMLQYLGEPLLRAVRTAFIYD